MLAYLEDRACWAKTSRVHEWTFLRMKRAMHRPLEYLWQQEYESHDHPWHELEACINNVEANYGRKRRSRSGRSTSSWDDIGDNGTHGAWAPGAGGHERPRLRADGKSGWQAPQPSQATTSVKSSLPTRATASKTCTQGTRVDKRGTTGFVGRLLSGLTPAIRGSKTLQRSSDALEKRSTRSNERARPSLKNSH